MQMVYCLYILTIKIYLIRQKIFISFETLVFMGI